MRMAGPGARVIAALIDAGVALTLALLLGNSTGRYFAERADVTLRMGSDETIWKGTLPMVLGALGNIVYGLPFAFLLVFLAEAISPATPGKFLTRTRVMAADGSLPSAGAHWTRLAVKSSMMWMLALAFVVGRWEIAVLALAAGAIVTATWIAQLSGGPPALHDRVAGTAVRKYP